MPVGNTTNHPSPGRDFVAAMLARKATRRCVLWPYAKNAQGYGQMSVRNRTVHVTHYVLDQLGKKRPSQRHVVAHSCDEPSCVNPAHLAWVLQRENVQQCHERKRNADVFGVRNPMSSLSEEAVRSIRNSRDKGIVLAERFGVSPATISRIRNKKTWKDSQCPGS